MNDNQSKTLIDPRALNDIRSLEQNGIPGLLAKAIKMYLEHSATLVRELEAAVQSGDADDQFRTAHSLKSSSASMGAIQLAAMCASLEAMGRQGETGDAPHLLEQMLPLYSAVCDALRADWLEAA